MSFKVGQNSINVKDFPYNARGDGVTDDSAAFQSAINAAIAVGASNAINIPSGTYYIASNLTFPSSVTVSFDSGAILKPSSTTLVTLSSINAGASQKVFDLSNISNTTTAGVTFAFPFNSPANKISAKWFGANGNNTGDDTKYVQAAIDAAQNVLNTSNNNPSQITYNDPSLEVFIPRGTYPLSATTDTACLTLPDYLTLSGEQSILYCSDLSKHILRIGAYLNHIEGLLFLDGYSAIVCYGYSAHYGGNVGTATAGDLNTITKCSFKFNAGPSIYLDAYEGRGSSAALEITNCNFMTSAVYYGGFDGCKFKDCYITIEQNTNTNLVFDDDGYIMAAFTNYDELVLDHCTMVPNSTDGYHGCWIKGVGNISATNTRFGGESQLVICRTQRKNIVYHGQSLDSLADPLAFPQLHFDNCAMSSAASHNWLEIYDRFPTRIDVRMPTLGTNTGSSSAPPQPPVLTMQSYGIWVDSVTCPTSTFLNTAKSYIVINIDAQRDPANTDFRFRTSNNPTSLTGQDIDITAQLKQYFITPITGGEANIGYSQNYWPAGKLDIASADSYSIVGFTNATADTSTGYTINGYTANAFNTYNQFLCAYATALPASLSPGEYTLSMSIKANFNGQVILHFQDYNSSVSYGIAFDSLDFSGGNQWQRVSSTFYYDGYSFDGYAGRAIGFDIADVSIGGTFYIGFFALHKGRKAKEWTYPGNANSQDIVLSEYHANSAPSTGNYVAGDRAWNTAPGHAGWICVSSGSPGIWAPLTGIVNVASVTSNYTIQTTDHFVSIGTLSSAITITLPPSPPKGLVHIIKDSAGSAATHSITISGNGALIDGSSNIAISSNYGSANLLYNGSGWSII